jgi:hypothetical protein
MYHNGYGTCRKFDETLETNLNKSLSIGYDSNTKLLEIIFHVINDEHIIVFHAMLYRKYYIKRMMS